MNIKEQTQNLISKLTGMMKNMPEEVAMSEAEEVKSEPVAETKTDEVPTWAQQLIKDQADMKAFLDDVVVEEVADEVVETPKAEAPSPQEPQVETVSKEEYDKLKKDFNKFKKQQEEAAAANEGFKHDPEAEVRNTNERPKMPNLNDRPFDARQNVYDTIAAFNKK